MTQGNAAIPDTVALDEQRCELVLLDQTRLPGETFLLRISDEQALFDAIVRLSVRGAPAIGVAAALGLYVCAARMDEPDAARLAARIKKSAAHLASSRPTAVNLQWALDRMLRRLDCSTDSARMIAALHEEALLLRDEDIEVCRRIGEHGLRLLHDGDGVLTHCNAGQLATVRYGTALAPIYLALERGIRLRVFADETRPLLQGARLTAYELSAAGADVTLLCDNMAADLMQSGAIQAVLVGCDRVARNGDAANKIGTLGVAVLARYFNIPFYVCAPTSTVDMACSDATEIVIEQRSPAEVTDLWYRQPMAPAGVRVRNPAFDVTPHELITALITEHGVVLPPFDAAFSALLPSPAERRRFSL